MENALRSTIWATCAMAVGCGGAARGTDDPGDGAGPGQAATASDTGSGDESADDGEDRLDVGMGPDGGPPCAGDLCVTCSVPAHAPCDDGTSPIAAFGLDCPGEPLTGAVVTSTGSGSIGVRTGFGTTSTFAPTEGSTFAVLGSGRVDELDTLNGEGSTDFCNDAIQAQYQGGLPLPAPLDPRDVGMQTCDDDPTLIGQGDCSNTIQGQFDQGFGWFDYTELRFTTAVPDDVASLSFDFAFFSIEYPDFFGRQFNDMFVAWLESETWTGNISFDASGNPISLNAGFLDHKDVPSGTDKDPACMGGCTAPALHGTCMEGHAGTNWLTTTAEVVPGETITMVLAVFDLSDPVLDSYVFLDNFSWGCEVEGGPVTTPVP